MLIEAEKMVNDEDNKLKANKKLKERLTQKKSQGNALGKPIEEKAVVEINQLSSISTEKIRSLY